MFQHQKKTIQRMVEPLKTGELLVKEGLIRMDDIDMALSIQEKRQQSLSVEKSRLLGMILCDLNLITPGDNYSVLHKYNKMMSIQSALSSKKILSRDEVLAAEKTSQQQDIPFISLLIKNNLVSTSGMQRLLFDLFHIPFRSISDFNFNEKDRKELVSVLDETEARKNRILPLVLKQNTILFGITDPENILFVRRLNERFPQFRFKSLFIPFSEFLWFYKIIYEGSPDPAVSSGRTLDLSLLLSYKASIKDPGQEDDVIQTLYRRYELLRTLIGNPKRDPLQDEFSRFILQIHKKITREYQSRSIVFSLKRENTDVKVMAFPKR